MFLEGLCQAQHATHYFTIIFSGVERHKGYNFRNIRYNATGAVDYRPPVTTTCAMFYSCGCMEMNDELISRARMAAIFQTTFSDAFF